MAGPIYASPIIIANPFFSMLGLRRKLESAREEGSILLTASVIVPISRNDFIKSTIRGVPTVRPKLSMGCILID